MQQCSELCGWISAVIAAVSFGSFGVPIRSTSNLNIDPLVMQTYKSTVCFLTCWLVVLMGESIRFTPWGIVSGMFWVPGATAGIYGIRNAGLAVSTGIWSAIIVMSSFCWGIIIFQEKVKSVAGTCYATLVLIIGLVGMSIYAEPPAKKDKLVKEFEIPLLALKDSMDAEEEEISKSYAEDVHVEHDEIVHNFSDSPAKTKVTKRRITVDTQFNHKADIEHDDLKSPRSPDADSTINSEIEIRRDPMVKDMTHACEHEVQKDTDGVFCCFGIFLNRRHLGIIGAIINGAWGGNNVIPMHYAKAQGFYGAGYLVSYSCGAMIVTIAMWVLRYLFCLYRVGGDAQKAYDSLPGFHFQEMWLPGLLAGGLYSLGNFTSLIAVSVLGQGVGFSFVQTSMFFSGLWGIFYFSEIQGTAVIVKWLLSSIITVIGILCLSFEHLTQIPDK